MNIPFFTFWIIIFILLGIFIFLSVENIKQVNVFKDDPYQINNSAIQFCYPGGNIENLYPITSAGPCFRGGVETLSYKFNNKNFLNDAKVLVDLAPTDYLTACSGFCIKYDPLQKVCNDTTTNNPRYYDCISRLKPTGECLQSAMPIAYIKSGDVKYAIIDGKSIAVYTDTTQPYYLKQTNQADCSNS
jgi:hypothetical protein